jgi:hypothetical protein
MKRERRRMAERVGFELESKDATDGRLDTINMIESSEIDDLLASTKAQSTPPFLVGRT